MQATTIMETSNTGYRTKKSKIKKMKIITMSNFPVLLPLKFPALSVTNFFFKNKLDRHLKNGCPNFIKKVNAIIKNMKITKILVGTFSRSNHESLRFFNKQTPASSKPNHQKINRHFTLFYLFRLQHKANLLLHHEQQAPPKLWNLLHQPQD